ncbi:MAG: hypothetical protein RLP14_07095 [Owenweeksia sp.]
MKKYFLATIVCVILLFLWSGFTQIFPWGVPTAQKITAQTKADSGEVPDLLRIEPHTLTTDKFDAAFNHKISTYTTDHTFSWIVTQPLKTDYTGYFIGEVITQLVVAMLLVLLLVLTADRSIKMRMLLVGITGLLAWAATYGQLLNWWGMPLTYAIGVGVNLISSWLVIAFLVAKLILKPKKQDI